MVDTKAIVAGFSTSNHLMSRVIRFFTRGKYSHSFIEFYSEDFDRRMVIESFLLGPRIVDYDLFLRQSKEYQRTRLLPPEGTVLNVKEGLYALGPFFGTPYDYASILGRVIVYVAAWFGRKIRNPWGSTRRDVCNENQLRFLKACGVLTEVDPEIESPESVFEKLTALGWKKVEVETNAS